MMRAATFLVAICLMGVPALAAGQSRAPAEKCMTFDAKQFGKDVKFQKVTPGQYHYLQGMWGQRNELPGAFPPGDGAAIVRAGHDPGGIIIFMRGAKVCPVVGTQLPFLPVPEAFLKMLGSIKTGAVDADGSEI